MFLFDFPEKRQKTFTEAYLGVSMVDLFAKISNDFWPLTSFPEKLHRKCLKGS